MNKLTHNLRSIIVLLTFVLSSFNTFAQKEAPNQPKPNQSLTNTKNTTSGVISPDPIIIQGRLDLETNTTSTHQVLETPGIRLEMEPGSVYTSIPHSTVGGNGDSNNSSTIHCPKMFVEVTIPFLQSCVASTAQVDYCNHGNADAINSYVDVAFPSELTLDSASLPYTIVGTGLYRFQLGTVVDNSCDLFYVHFTTICDSSLLNEEHCINAHIYPDTLCNSVYSDYLLSVDGKCVGSNAKFTVHNHGMAVTLGQHIQYVIIEDHLLAGGNPLPLFKDTLVLDKDSTLELNVSGTYSGYRLKLLDSLGTEFAYSSVQNCSATSNNSTTTNHYNNLFWNDSHLPFESQGCAINGKTTTTTNVVPNSLLAPLSNPAGSNSNSKESSSSKFELLETEETIIQVYPNPFSQYAVIKIEGPIADHFTFRLYNATGQTVQFRNLSEQREFRIERKNLLNGMYLYQIESEGQLIGAGKVIIK